MNAIRCLASNVYISQRVMSTGRALVIAVCILQMLVKGGRGSVKAGRGLVSDVFIQQ